MKNVIYLTKLFMTTLFSLVTILQSDELDILVGEPDISKFPDIVFTISVKDSAGELIEYLDTSMVRLYEDSVRNKDIKVQTLKEVNDKIAILVSVDASLSMAGAPMDSVKSAIRSFVNNINENTLVSLSTFHDQVETLLPFTSNRDSLLLYSDSIRAIGRNTELFEGVVKGLEYLHKNKDLPNRKAIVVLSDGKDEGTAYTDDDAISLALEYGIPIFTIGYHTKAEKKYLKILDRISFKTGGRYNDAPSSMNIHQVYNQVYEQINSQQSIYFTANTFRADSLEHEIKINIVSEEGNGFATVTFRSPFLEKRNNSSVIILLAIFGVLFLFIFLSRRNTLNSQQEKEKLLIEKENLENQLKEQKKKKTTSEPEKESDQLKVEDSNIPDPRFTTISSSSSQPIKTLHIFFDDGPLAGENILITNGLTLGRSEENAITISDSTISSNHCEIIKKGLDFFLMDLKSTNGTFINRKKVEQKSIQVGDKIKIGKVNITIK